MSVQSHCPVCGTAVARAAGLCPRCAFEQMLGGVSVPAPSGPGSFPRAFGEYELLGEIARGGMGIVYRARQVTLDRIVALKVILSSHLASPDFVERFRVEARSAAGLDHPNIVPIYEIGEHSGEPFFSMKLVEGETLATRNAHVWNRGAETPDPSQIRSAIELVVALARAVHYAHQRGVLHRDIKPNNILLGPGDTPYLTDFGLAKLLDVETGVTRTSAVLGTPSYMSPEQARGEARSLTVASDVYGLGAVLYELLTGRPPFVGGNSVETLRMVLEEEARPLTRFNPTLDSDLETICLKCLEKDPAARYLSAGDLADDLERWMRHEPIVARPVTPTEKLRKWVRRRPGAAIAAASAIMALLIVTVVSTVAAVRMNRARRSAEEANIRLEQHLRDMQWDKAEELASSGKTGESLAYLARLVRTSPNPAIPAARIVSMLNLRSFPLPRGEPMRHNRGVSDLDFSPSGALLATASVDNTIAVWSVKDQKLEATFAHPLPVIAVKFHPSGDLLVGASQSGEAVLWDLKSRDARRRFSFDPLHAPFPSFNRDGRWLALRTGPSVVTVFETDSGKIALGPQRMGGSVRALAFGTNEDALIVGADDGSIRLFDLPSGRVLPLEINLNHPAAAVVLTPDGRRVISGEARRLAIWDRATGMLEREIVTGVNEVVGLSVSSDGRRVLSLPYLEPPQIWDIEIGRALSQPFTSAVNFLGGQFSPDGNQVVLWSAEGVAFVVDGQNGRPLLEPAHQGGSIVRTQFSPDGSLIATATEDGSAQLWDVRMRESKRIEFPGLPELREAVLSPDGESLFTSSENLIQRRSARTGEIIGSPMRHQALIFMAQVSPDGKLLVSISYDRAAHRWDLANHREMEPPLTHQRQLTFVTFSPDSRLILTMSNDRTARLWDAASGEPVCDPLDHVLVPLYGNFDPTGSRFLTAGFDGTVRVWTVPEGRLLFETLPHYARIWQARFSPDGRLIASASADRTVRLWDADTGRPVGSPIIHGRAVLTVRFREDGAALVTTTEDGEVRLWDVQTGQPISRPMRHSDITWNAVFSHDGKRLLTGSYDTTARVWDAGTGYPISDPLPHSGDVFRAIFSRDGERIITTCSAGVLSFWEAPVPREGVPDWFPDFVESLAGKCLNEQGEIENAPLLSLRRYVFEKRENPGAYEKWVRSFLIDRLEGNP